MRVWIVAGEYPTQRRPGRGSFVRDQVAALRAAGHEVEVFHRRPPTARGIAARVRGHLPARQGSDSQALPGTADLSHGDDGSMPLLLNDQDEPISPADLAQPGLRAQLRLGTQIQLHAARTGGRRLHDTAGTWAAARVLERDLVRFATRSGLPDVLHAHNALPAGLAIVGFARKHKVPTVVTEHSSAFLQRQLTAAEVARASSVYQAADAVLAVSPAQARSLPMDLNRVQIVPNVVLTSRFTLRTPNDWHRGSVLAVGALTPNKGMHRLIEAYAGLPESLRTEHPLRIVGVGPQRRSLEALAETLGLPVAEIFLGRIPRVTLREEYTGAAVVVSASDVETFGVTLIEAMAAGVPFVATRSGGPDSIWSLECGVLVPRRDVAALRNGLRNVLTDSSWHLLTADQARRELADRRYSAAAVAAHLDAVYTAVTRTGAMS